MCLNVFHLLSMLMHELEEVVLSRMVGGDTLFQPLE